MALLVVGVLGAGLPPAGVARAGQGDEGEILATYTLPEIPLAEVQNEALPDHPIADDRGFLLGGIGSDLWRAPDDPEDEFWMLTDRGPNGQIEVDGENRRTFPVPDFTPHVLHVRVADEAIEVIEALPVVGQSGEPVTGLSNLDGPDEEPYDHRAETALDYEPSGLDSEGLVRTEDGEFWLAEEYRPSLVRLDETGRVLARYVPAGVELEGADYPVEDTLPAIYAARQNNRGFEGLALSPDGTTLYAALQSPLANPDEDTGESSLVTRILAVDVASGEPAAEYAYVFEEATEFDPDPEVTRDEMKLSGLVALDADTLLVLERTDAVAKLYTVELAAATDLLGGDFDDPDTSPSLEATDDPATVDVEPLAKTLLIDLSELDGMPEKIEGVAVLDATTVAVANDNDFDIGELDEDGNNVGEGRESRLLLVRTPPIPGLADAAGTPEPAATPVAGAGAEAPILVEVVADDY